MHLGEQVIQNGCGDCRGLIAQLHIMLRADFFCDHIGVDKLDTQIGQIVLEERRFTRAISPGQDPKLFVLRHRSP